MTKRELQEIPHIDRRIRLKEDELKTLREIAMNVSPSMAEGVPKGSTKADKMRKVDKYLDLEEEIKAERHRLMELKEHAYHLIRQLEGMERELMERRYMIGQNWETIAFEIGYTERHILRLHGSILKNLFKNPKTY